MKSLTFHTHTLASNLKVSPKGFASLGNPLRLHSINVLLKLDLSVAGCIISSVMAHFIMYNISGLVSTLGL